MRLNKKTAILKKTLLSAALFGISSAAMAAEWEVKITNLTHGNHFTPLLLTAHDHDLHLFEVGQPASLGMEHLAECGHLTPLLNSDEVVAANVDKVENPAEGFLAPGASTTATIVTDMAHLSIVSMILPTNDGFVGLDSEHIPEEAGTYTYYLNAYDAGTEKNDEILMTSGDCSYNDVGMMPGAPGGDAGANGTGVATEDEANPNIHVHRGALGDQDENAGKSDLNSLIHRWQNPVAKVTVTVK